MKFIHKLSMIFSGFAAAVLPLSSQGEMPKDPKFNINSANSTIIEIRDKFGSKVTLPLNKEESRELIDWMKEMGFENIEESSNSHNSADSCSDNVFTSN